MEVGCRGFPANSMAAFIRALGYTGKKRKSTLKKIGEKAEEASRSIWYWSNFNDKKEKKDIQVEAT